MLGQSPHARLVMSVLLVLAVGGGVFWLVTGPSRHYHAGEGAQKTEPVIRNGNVVTVPEGSPVRGKLAIEAVGEKEIKRDLVLPAVVEADPAHLIKVSPPLSGLVNQLKVELG